MSALGCDTRGIDGLWGNASAHALASYAAATGRRNTPPPVNAALLEDLRTRDGQVCTPAKPAASARKRQPTNTKCYYFAGARIC